MVTIWKYPLRITTDIQVVRMPAFSKILSIQKQNEMPCLWALVESDLILEEKKIRMYGTGFEIDISYKSFLGTVQIEPYVWHFFEVQ